MPRVSFAGRPHESTRLTICSDCGSTVAPAVPMLKGEVEANGRQLAPGQNSPPKPSQPEPSPVTGISVLVLDEVVVVVVLVTGDVLVLVVRCEVVVLVLVTGVDVVVLVTCEELVLVLVLAAFVCEVVLLVLAVVVCQVVLLEVTREDVVLAVVTCVDVVVVVRLVAVVVVDGEETVLVVEVTVPPALGWRRQDSRAHLRVAFASRVARRRLIAEERLFARRWLR